MGKCDEAGNCTKCMHSLEIYNARKKGDENALAALRKTCIKCIRGCEKCRYGRRKDALESFIAEYERRSSAESLTKEMAAIKKDKCGRCSIDRGSAVCNNCQFRQRLHDISLALGVFSERIKSTGKSFSAEYAKDLCDAITVNHCYKCDHCPSTDDNPSRCGREVVSFDAAENPDTIMPFADPFAFPNSMGDKRDFDSPKDENECGKSVTLKLPQDIEDALRQELCNLSGKLDHVDRALVFFLMAGGTMTDFGKMKWVPKEFSQTMSKQCVYGRYKKIVKAVPILSAVAHGMIGKGKGGGAKPKKAKTVFQPELFADE